MPETDERSGVHLTGKDSGWPVASEAEPDPHKDGSGTDDLPKAHAADQGVIGYGSGSGSGSGDGSGSGSGSGEGSGSGS